MSKREAELRVLERNFKNAKFNEEVNRLQELLTPLSIIIAVQLAVFLYFLDEKWNSPFDLTAPILGLTSAVLALVFTIVYGVFAKWDDTEDRPSAKSLQRIRRITQALTSASLILFMAAIVEIVIKTWWP